MTKTRPSHRMPRWWERRRQARASAATTPTESVDEASGEESGSGGAVEAEPIETYAPQRESEEAQTESVDDDVAENAETVGATSEDAETDSDEAPESESGGEAAESAEEGDTRARRPAGKRLAVAVGMAAALFVGSAAFAGATVQPYLADQAAVATKLEIARTAADAITTLWTYTPDNMSTLADRAANYLSGDFEAQYRKFVDGIAPTNKQAKITNNTQVTGVAVESLDVPDAVAIVYTNTTSTSPLTKGIPSLKYLSYRLFMKRAHGRWLVNRMTTITSLDLTPRV
ncbi:mammalian cell entry protein [Mycobacterium noviomagense]|uniref:Mammalian cell entry protein n=1 Tax=Mycobacterium noviomagense TaxID=459858 RepID=A0ABX3T169_9MYCO|nr:mammalian cell entry protein [Mycobacterium noviomagense]